MISVSFAMFTAVWQYVANECRVATMHEEGGEREKERRRERERPGPLKASVVSSGDGQPKHMRAV